MRPRGRAPCAVNPRKGFIDMAYRIVCPLFTADPTVTGHGSATGYSVGGALSHASRCAEMNSIMADRGLAIDLKLSTRGVQSEDEFFAAAAAKLSRITSAPVAPAAAAENVVIIDGVAYRKA